MDDSDFAVSFVLVLTFSAVVLISSFWVMKDAKEKRIPITGDTFDLNTGEWAWFGSCLLLWGFTFPYYLFRRSNVLANRLAGGAGATPPWPPAVTAPVAPAAPVSPQTSWEQDLRSLARLKADGLVTEDEFEQKKRTILAKP